LICGVRALARRVVHLRNFGAAPDAPLSSYWDGTRWCLLTTTHITTALRRSAHLIGPGVGFFPTDINARALRAGGAMALLCAHVDTDVIRLLGRWRSDEMLRYLHTQAQPLMRGFSRRMLTAGNFTLIPTDDLPDAPPPVLRLP
jgi:hypothetical protein